MISDVTHAIACPTCLKRQGVEHLSNRIGNRRGDCRTCNAFVQRVNRITAARMKDEFPAEYQAIKYRTEQEVWNALMTGSE